MKVNFKVAKCTPNQTQGFVLTLVVEETAKVFGMIKNVKRTYYIGGMPAAVVVGAEFEEEMDNFTIVEREYDVVGDDGKKETIFLKWLHVKPAFERA